MRHFIVLLATLTCSLDIQAGEATAELHRIDAQGIGASVGTIAIREVAGGLEFTPKLSGLPAGQHGFHLHETGSCEPGEKDGKIQAGLAAGSHYDPDKTAKHLGPQGAGHKGDLPALTVAADGSASSPVTASRLTLADVQGRALIVHAEPDNYADQPGGARIACGVIR